MASALKTQGDLNVRLWLKQTTKSDRLPAPNQKRRGSFGGGDSEVSRTRVSCCARWSATVSSPRTVSSGQLTNAVVSSGRLAAHVGQLGQLPNRWSARQLAARWSALVSPERGGQPWSSPRWSLWSAPNTVVSSGQLAAHVGQLRSAPEHGGQLWSARRAHWSLWSSPNAVVGSGQLAAHVGQLWSAPGVVVGARSHRSLEVRSSM